MRRCTGWAAAGVMGWACLPGCVEPDEPAPRVTKVTLSGRADEGSAAWRPMDFVDEHRGWVVTDDGSLMRTFDGGSTWARQTVADDRFVIDADFVEPDTGWVIVDGATGTPGIFVTVDGGAQWSPQGPGIDEAHPPTGVEALDASTIFVTLRGHADAGVIALVSRDAGLTWKLGSQP